MKMRFGRLESMVLAYVQMNKQKIVREAEIADVLNLTRIQSRKILFRLVDGHYAARIAPGVFLLPDRLSVSGVWLPDEATALSALMKVRKAKYQVCGSNAFNRYGYDGQVPNRIYVYNDRISGERKIGLIGITLIKVAENRLGSVEVVTQPNGETMIYSSRVRTLVDAVYDWSRFNSLPQGFHWIEGDLKNKMITPERLIQETLKYGDIGTIRRMGLLLEKSNVKPALLNKLNNALRPTRSFIPWIPVKPKRGKVSVRWGVIDNGLKESE